MSEFAFGSAIIQYIRHLGIRSRDIAQLNILHEGESLISELAFGSAIIQYIRDLGIAS